MLPEALRRLLPLTETCLYFQTGSVSPTPLPVLEAAHEASIYRSRYGPSSPAVKDWLDEQVSRAKVKLAALLQVSPHELGWVTNTTQGMQLIVRGLPWQQGDEVIISSAEHISSRLMWRGLARQRGVIIKEVAVGPGDEAFLAGLTRALTPRTRLISISHVSTQDGRRLPVAVATALARERGILTLIDGAQAVGQFPVAVGALNCDFYVASVHKWLFGPHGLGFVYIARDRLAELHPFFIPEPDNSADYRQYMGELTAGKKVELGTTNFGLPVGLSKAIDLLTDLGLDTIEAHSAALVTQLREGLSALNGVRIVTPEPPAAQGSGLLTLVVAGCGKDDYQQIVSELFEQHGIVIKYQFDLIGIRISLACFNTAEEVETLLTTLPEALQKRARDREESKPVRRPSPGSCHA